MIKSGEDLHLGDQKSQRSNSRFALAIAILLFLNLYWFSALIHSPRLILIAGPIISAALIFVVKDHFRLSLNPYSFLGETVQRMPRCYMDRGMFKNSVEDWIKERFGENL